MSITGLPVLSFSGPTKIGAPALTAAMALVAATLAASVALAPNGVLNTMSLS